MKIKYFLTLTLLLTLQVIFGQDMAQYSAYIKQAETLYDSKSYKLSSAKYKEAFDLLDGKAYPRDRYNAACSYALAGNIDGSFYHLFRLSDKPTSYKNLKHLTSDTDLTLLYTDKRWDELIKKVKSNKDEAEKNFDKPLVAILDKIHEEDQKYRL